MSCTNSSSTSSSPAPRLARCALFLVLSALPATAAAQDVDPLIFDFDDHPTIAPQPDDPDVVILDSDAERATALHLEARKHLKKNGWAEAARLLQEAYSIAPRFDITANLGAALLMLDKHREAAKYLDEARKTLPDYVEPERRDKLLLYLTQAQEHVGWAVVQGPSGARLLVDGREVGTLPMDDQLYLDPGEHRFEADLDGRRTAVVARTLEKNRATVVQLGELDHGGAAAPLPGADHDAAAIAGAWSGIAVGALATIIGGGLLGAWAVTKSDARDLRNEIVDRSGSACPGGDPACDDLRKKVENEARFHNAGLPLVIGGGAALAIATVTLIVAMNDADEAGTDDAKIQLLPIVGGHTYGIGVTGQF